nr:MAG TPA: hypothetical protein [Caudoviricetes sp.]
MQRKNDREVRVPIAVPKQQINLYKLWCMARKKSRK